MGATGYVEGFGLDHQEAIVQLIYRANHQDAGWWPGTFERKRLTQHAIVSRATKDGLPARYFDDGREVTLVCHGSARLVADLVDDLQKEHVLGFELYATMVEFNAVLDLIDMRSLPKDRVDFNVDRVPPYDTADPRAVEPHDYDRRTLPELIRALVARPDSSHHSYREPKGPLPPLPFF